MRFIELTVYESGEKFIWAIEEIVGVVPTVDVPTITMIFHKNIPVPTKVQETVEQVIAMIPNLILRAVPKEKKSKS